MRTKLGKNAPGREVASLPARRAAQIHDRHYAVSRGQTGQLSQGIGVRSVGTSSRQAVGAAREYLGRRSSALPSKEERSDSSFASGQLERIIVIEGRLCTAPG
jgi:hypothetical protein